MPPLEDDCDAPLLTVTPRTSRPRQQESTAPAEPPLPPAPVAVAPSPPKERPRQEAEEALQPAAEPGEETAHALSEVGPSVAVELASVEPEPEVSPAALPEEEDIACGDLASAPALPVAPITLQDDVVVWSAVPPLSAPAVPIVRSSAKAAEPCTPVRSPLVPMPPQSARKNKPRPPPLLQLSPQGSDDDAPPAAAARAVPAQAAAPPQWLAEKEAAEVELIDKMVSNVPQDGSAEISLDDMIPWEHEHEDLAIDATEAAPVVEASLHAAGETRAVPTPRGEPLTTDLEMELTHSHSWEPEDEPQAAPASPPPQALKEDIQLEAYGFSAGEVVLDAGGYDDGHDEEEEVMAELAPLDLDLNFDFLLDDDEHEDGVMFRSQCSSATLVGLMGDSSVAESSAAQQQPEIAVAVQQLEEPPAASPRSQAERPSSPEASVASAAETCITRRCVDIDSLLELRKQELSVETWRTLEDRLASSRPPSASSRSSRGRIDPGPRPSEAGTAPSSHAWIREQWTMLRASGSRTPSSTVGSSVALFSGAEMSRSAAPTPTGSSEGGVAQSVASTTASSRPSRFSALVSAEAMKEKLAALRGEHSGCEQGSKAEPEVQKALPPAAALVQDADASLPPPPDFDPPGCPPTLFAHRQAQPILQR